MPMQATVAYLEARSTRDPAELQEKLEAALFALSLATEERDAMVTQEDHDSAVSSLEDKVSDLEQARDRAEERLETFLQADEDSIEHVLAKMLKEQDKHDAEMARAKAKEEQAYAASKRWRDEARKDSEARAEMQTRMAVWLEDRTAVETADYYYEKYKASQRDAAKRARAVDSAIAKAHHAAGRSKVKHELLDMLVASIRIEESKL